MKRREGNRKTAERLERKLKTKELISIKRKFAHTHMYICMNQKDKVFSCEMKRMEKCNRI